jgi:predicted component of type VI protein secretion system
VPKLLSENQKKERVRTGKEFTARTCKEFVARACKEFLATVNCPSLVMLENIMTMSETMPSYHMPEMKKQSKQRLRRAHQV